MKTSPPRVDVEVTDLQSAMKVDRERLIAWVRTTIAEQAGRPASISVTLVDDRAIREINARHLQHDYPTDVISFTLSAPDDEELAGELIVSAEMALTTAVEHGHDPSSELALYVVHGLLHICGLDDESPDRAAIMRVRESEILRILGLSNPFHRVGASLAPGLIDEGRENEPWPR